MAIHSSRATLVRYLLLQVPGTLVVLAVAWWLVRVGTLPLWGAAVGLGLWILKDLALFPFLRSAYDPAQPSATDRLIGMPATVTRRLAPGGYVRVRGELWRARLVAGAAAVEPGERVVVREAQGLTLGVERP